MNVLILTFSPAGSTRKISEIFEKKLVSKGHGVQLLDLTGNKDVFVNNKQSEYLTSVVKKHDVLCIASPVYEKHVEFYVQKVLRALPKPDALWGKYAIPFFTYGGISTGVALGQAVDLLRKSGRNTIAAMKLEASHIKTKKLHTRVNENMPGDEALPYIDDLVNRVSEFEKQKTFINRKELNYQNTKERLICGIMKEKMLHKYKYGKLIIQEDKCNACGTCVKACPIQRIDNTQAKPSMTNTLPECIHCFSCVNSCPKEAITYDNGDEGWATIERIFSLVAKEGSLFRSMEEPKSAVYPILK